MPWRHRPSAAPRRRWGAGRRRPTVDPKLVEAAPDVAGRQHWFRCLADSTCIQILHLLAANDGPMTIGQILQQVGTQRTVQAAASMARRLSVDACSGNLARSATVQPGQQPMQQSETP
jgi:hypothetical protein